MNKSQNKIAIIVVLSVFTFGCSQNVTKTKNTDNKTVMLEKEEVKTEIKTNKIMNYSNLTEEQWKELLSAEDFNVLRKKGTESPNTGKYNNNKQEGTYVCKGCGTELFTSKTKYESGSGWPAFSDEINNNVLEIVDNSHGMKRVEIVCKTCKGHLGHVFTDGPAPTGNRYCVNSASLNFVKKEE